MKTTRLLAPLAMFAVAALSLSSCQEKANVEVKNEVSESTVSQIKALGFSATEAKKVEGGVLVEGDIMLTDEMLASTPDYKMMRVGEDEQYRTTNLVTGLPRTITVRVSTTLPSAYVTAADEAIRRYNAENLRIKFSRVTSGGSIVLTKSPSGASYLASAGFPSGGNPYNQVLVNSDALGTSYATTTIASVLAHEIGHCIGFRHTDYMSRQYSCGGSAVNEGASTVGAILVPGTPSGPDPNSWMLACIGTGVNRPFNTNDRTALNYLY
ncbi:Dual-action HEIGH metallo-peptidase [Hymenobacter gelipurpurascens]|uniref:Dual-action HEIGH metallo-peptidase n=1 Tax=Hymenobacter gelipurpurascens TaxID=89968 RepID=A0A212UAN2_9BACT|nr:M57 family metalloprotease [Hymenobacter gelipurpurascens]SNC75256.1 Dual-action HEIGH metallo-peptidase [Hymenobacter gelipurpurascens]